MGEEYDWVSERARLQDNQDVDRSAGQNLANLTKPAPKQTAPGRSGCVATHTASSLKRWPSTQAESREFRVDRELTEFHAYQATDAAMGVVQSK